MEFKIDLSKETKKTLAAIKERFSDQKMDTAVALAAADILYLVRQATDAGISAYGFPFMPYSKNYELYRIKKGRSAKVNLQFTGQMMNSFTVKQVSEGVYRVGPTGFGLHGKRMVSNGEKLSHLQKMKKRWIVVGWGSKYKGAVKKRIIEALTKD